MTEKFMNASEAAELWKISLHRVQELCKNGRIAGVTRFGRSWMIPVNASKPEDSRRKESRNSVKMSGVMPLPRKSPFLNMTDLYTEPGRADEIIESLSSNSRKISSNARMFAKLYSTI